MAASVVCARVAARRRVARHPQPDADTGTPQGLLWPGAADGWPDAGRGTLGGAGACSRGWARWCRCSAALQLYLWQPCLWAHKPSAMSSAAAQMMQQQLHDASKRYVAMQPPKPKPWVLRARRVGIVLAVCAFLALLAAAAVASLAIAVRMDHALDQADVAIGKIDSMYDVIHGVLQVACATPDSIPPDLRPVLCGGPQVVR